MLSAKQGNHFYPLTTLCFCSNQKQFGVFFKRVVTKSYTIPIIKVVLSMYKLEAKYNRLCDIEAIMERS